MRRGSLFFIYLSGYGVGRFWIELLRIDTDFRLLGLSRNNFNALLIVAVGAFGLWWWERRASVPTTAERLPGTYQPALADADDVAAPDGSEDLIDGGVARERRADQPTPPTP
ncbi:MAG: prolipoprotein diacylglyceryl transferase family protein [Egibacteraceae bacterium]